MDIYRNNQSVALTVEIDGPALSATYRVFDQNDQVIIDTIEVAGFIQNSVAVDIIVDAAFNQLAEGEVRAMRRVEITPYDVNGALKTSTVEYIIEALPTSIIGVNSYQTLSQAKLTAMDMPHLDIWNTADDRMIVSAMTEAHFRLGQFAYRMEDDRGLDIVVENIRSLTINDLLLLPSAFLIALRKAQISEADIVMGGGSVHRKREDGLMSDTVGESKIMFRPGKPVVLPVDRRTLSYLSGYIYHGLSLTRT